MIPYRSKFRVFPLLYRLSIILSKPLSRQPSRPSSNRLSMTHVSRCCHHIVASTSYVTRWRPSSSDGRTPSRSVASTGSASQQTSPRWVPLVYIYLNCIFMYILQLIGIFLFLSQYFFILLNSRPLGKLYTLLGLS